MKAYFKILSPVLVLSFLLTSCLKDKGYNNHEYGLKPTDDPYATHIVGFLQPYELVGAKSFNRLPDPVVEDYDFFVLCISGRILPYDVTVNMAIDNSIIAAEVAATGVPLTLLPASAYTMPLNIVCKAGSDFTPIAIKVNKSGLNPSTNYALGLKITGTSDPSIRVAPQNKTILLSLLVNIYAGNYHSVGYVYHPSVPRDVLEDKVATPVGISGVDMYLGDLGPNGYKGRFIVNPITNALTITAAPGAAGAPYTMFTSGLPGSNPGYSNAWPGGPACNNTWDPVNKIFYVRYGYMGSTGWRVSEERLTKY